ncbi:tetranectin-like [Drosophila takahashii]|uniref:tetranectin-like n=1 Tax=Drosophila takahashii TaxID=29030 RepID=UPI003899394D
MKYIGFLFLLYLVAPGSTALNLSEGQTKDQDCSSYICESVRMILEHMVVMDERIKKLEDFSSQFKNFKNEFSYLKEIQNSANENLKINLIRLENRTTEVASDNAKFKEVVNRLQNDLKLQRESLKTQEEKYIKGLETLEKNLTTKEVNKTAEINKLSKRLDGLDTQIESQNKKTIAQEKELSEKMNKNIGLQKLEELTTKQLEMEKSMQKINETLKNVAYKKIGSKGYLIQETERRSWNDSRAFCMDLGGHLVSPQSQSELDALGKELKMDSHLYWMGVHDFSKEGEFVLDKTGQKAKFLKWRQNPDNYNNEDCVEFAYSGNQWGMNDNACSTRLNFVCERQLV